MTLCKVLGLGLVVRDEALLVDDFAVEAVRTRYRARRTGLGGMMGTAVAQSAALGVRTHVLSMLGDDDDGRALLRELRNHGVGTRGVIRSREHPTSTAVVLVDRRTHERRFLVPDRRKIEADAPDFDLAGLTRNTVLMIDGHFPRQAARAARLAREKGAIVVADFHSPRPACLRLLPYVDVPILPREFGRAWHGGTPRQVLHALREAFGGRPVITLGERGALALDAGRVIEIPGRRTRVRDTTGAGDVFHGAFAAGLCRGKGFVDARRLASRASALCCTALGGTSRLLRADEVAFRPPGRHRGR
ncbi:MAG: hypothetical protein GY944_07545 [bacterium]|nr:hypothetical protein [bacterium]